MITFNKLFFGIFFMMSGFVGFMFKNARQRNVIYHEVNSSTGKPFNKQLTVFFISDIHKRKIDKKLLLKINDTIDVVIIGGDLAEKGVPIHLIATNVEQLANLGPLFYVWGNNDREVGEQSIRAILARFNGEILDNESMGIPGHPDWGICGTDDPSSQKVDINSTLHSIDQYKEVIAVMHTPSLFRKVEQYYHPRIMLAGHTHGGQIRLGRWGLEEKGTFSFSEGRAKLISNGYGTTKLPFRLGAMPECHVITIHYTESEPKER